MRKIVALGRDVGQTLVLRAFERFLPQDVQEIMANG